MNIWENVAQLAFIIECVLYTHAANEARKGSPFWCGFLDPLGFIN